MIKELFKSAIRKRGDLAGVFEADDETGYFYLYDETRKEERKILDSIHIFSGATDIMEGDVEIKWDQVEERVALFIRDEPWALFNTSSGVKFGGNYQQGEKSNIPKEELANL